MNAGRELDTLITEKVMGIRPGQWFLNGKPAFEGHSPSLPNYSTSIEAAWEVMEKMRSKGFFVEMNLVDKWEIEFNLNDGRFLQNADTTGFGRADTAPHAICLAALEAIG